VEVLPTSEQQCTETNVGRSLPASLLTSRASMTVQIPDDFAEQLGDGVSDDLSRRALEALLAEEYRLGHLDKPALGRAGRLR
jgi:hypothetical protein